MVSTVKSRKMVSRRMVVSVAIVVGLVKVSSVNGMKRMSVLPSEEVSVLVT